MAYGEGGQSLEDVIFPPVTPRADGHSPLGLRLAKRPARGAPGWSVLISCERGFVHRRGRRWRARASARARGARSLSDARSTAACIAETPIPLEGGYERAPEHNARCLCELGLRQAVDCRPHNPRYVQAPMAACEDV